jgi:ferritin-like metal-binding protein YciE
MSLANLKDLFLHELKDIYDAEKQIAKALPKMIKAVSSDELRSALEEHHGVTEKHVERLEQIFGQLGKPVRGKKCLGMEGLLKEGSDFLKEDAEDAVRDAGIIGAAQKVEHYEIAMYGTLATYAKLLEMEEASTLLEDTLAEEKEADETLSELASKINVEAEQEEGEEEEMAVPRKRM